MYLSELTKKFVQIVLIGKSFLFIFYAIFSVDICQDSWLFVSSGDVILDRIANQQMIWWFTMLIQPVTG